MYRNRKKIIRTVTAPLSIIFFEEVMLRMKKDGYETVVVTSLGKELEAFKQRYEMLAELEEIFAEIDRLISAA